VTGWLIGVALRLNKDGLNHRIAISAQMWLRSGMRNALLVQLRAGCLRMRGGCIKMERAFAILQLQPAQPDVQENSSERLHLNQYFPGVAGITTATAPIISAIAKGAL
jgi:hypothetical protein